MMKMRTKINDGSERQRDRLHRSLGLRIKSFGERISRTKYFGIRPGQKKRLKRRSNKKVRYVAKLDPEFAPKRMTYRGWID